MKQYIVHMAGFEAQNKPDVPLVVPTDPNAQGANDLAEFAHERVEQSKILIDNAVNRYKDISGLNGAPKLKEITGDKVDDAKVAQLIGVDVSLKGKPEWKAAVKEFQQLIGMEGSGVNGTFSMRTALRAQEMAKVANSPLGGGQVTLVADLIVQKNQPTVSIDPMNITQDSSL